MSEPTFEENTRDEPGLQDEEAAAAGEFIGTDDTGTEFGGTDDTETSFGGDDLGTEDVDPAAGTGLGGTDVESPEGVGDPRHGGEPTGGEPF